MFKSIDYKNLIYIDIETAGIKENYSDLSEQYQEAWKYHCERNKLVEDFTEINLNLAWHENVALIPEFSQVICVSIGKFTQLESGEYKFVTQTYYIKDGVTELDVLLSVKNYIDANTGTLVAHAGKDFDYPFIIRRSIINDILPSVRLHIVGKKPWEINLLDTKEIWKFGGYRSASLATICASLDIPSPKADMSGKDTHKYFHVGRFVDIAKYCSNDIKALALIVQKMCLTGLDITPINIEYTK